MTVSKSPLLGAERENRIMDALEMRNAAAARVAGFLDGLAKPLDQEDRLTIVTLSASTAISTDPEAGNGEDMAERHRHFVEELRHWDILPQKDPFTFVIAQAAYFVALASLFEMKAVQS